MQLFCAGMVCFKDEDDENQLLTLCLSSQGSAAKREFFFSQSVKRSKTFELPPKPRVSSSRFGTGTPVIKISIGAPRVPEVQPTEQPISLKRL